MKDKNGTEISPGDKVRVPDNPEICPVDTGTVRLGKSPWSDSGKDELMFYGQLSIRPMSFFESNEIEILTDGA